jgi:hypothetical protein
LFSKDSPRFDGSFDSGPSTLDSSSGGSDCTRDFKCSHCFPELLHKYSADGRIICEPVAKQPPASVFGSLFYTPVSFFFNQNISQCWGCYYGNPQGSTHICEDFRSFNPFTAGGS